MSQKAYGRSPLLQLLRYMKPFRSKVLLATLFSVLNKLFDLAAPMLIGAAVDVVVKGDESLIAGLGITDPFDQLTWLAGVTAVVWIMESVFQYLFEIYWREDRKSTRLNSSHVAISYAVFCLKKKIQ